ncbi:DNA polymerase II large subunit [Natronoarchaeum philippinense]|uniref:DNA polymerase II large subunit n=1 Tax=Natronoarchaeum philippinense TaxID=558529 RepID=A0A285P026_NATPI|nr:DNA-directed DNA polymerase II large subunit [Natronoarchaeum philippinense]SNZ15080.1 DNA polymerase II large subunit [Natronoarchaeum philippinense]
MREADERYFERLENPLEDAFEVAREAKRRGGDPEPEVEIPTARDMADRVENILGIDGVAERVRDLEGEMSREEAALELVTDFVDGEVGDYESREGKVEGAVRTAVALLTEGVVAAPIEGIDRVEINENDDGTEFVAVYYAGPIRSAGGTAQALSVLVADYARSLLGVDEFKARDDEIERYAEEVGLYDKETGLQYSPKDKETKFITKNCPIMLDGEATGDEEVSGFRDLERIDTNSARGGMCLVLAEGIALKAPKIKRYTSQLDEVEWPWLTDLMEGTIGKDDGEDADDADAEEEASADDGEAAPEDADDAGADADEEDAEPAGPPRVDPSKKFLRDLIAGRPVFSHPSESGGFRLRYGRSRNHGFATAGVHPATMHLVDDFLATGTQIKTEMPGKAAGVVPVDTIEGPTVRLANGEVRRIDDPETALELRNGVEKILDLGEYLVNYGEFVENNHPLAPASYTVEWWVQEFAETDADVQAMEDSVRVDLSNPDPSEAIEWAREYDAPLHPDYTYLWHDIDAEQFAALADAVAAGAVETESIDHATADADTDDHLVLDRDETVREAIEALLVGHTQTDDHLRIPVWRPLALTLGFEIEAAADPAIDGEVAKADGGTVSADSPTLERTWDDLSEDARAWPNAMEAIREVAPFEVRERAPTRVGNRMGRPEKSEERELSPAVHTLFPIGEAGGSQRDVAAAGKHADTMEDTPGMIEVEVARRECTSCGAETFKAACPECDSQTEPHYQCPDCETRLEPDESGRVYCERCEVEGTCVEQRVIDINEEYRDALGSVGERENAFEMLKGVKGLTSATKTPEPIEKGILRAKHDVSAFKDGTVRYDMTDLPVTSVRPSELDVTADQFRQLGYEEDIHGDPLQHDDQLVELKVQDIVLSDGAAEHMLQTADFVDDLLDQYYGLDRYYEVEERDDLVGKLVFGMAPHTSAAVVGRVVGFTSAAVGYAHPFFHASKRRNCFHPETEIRYREGGRRSIYERDQLAEDELPAEEQPRTATIRTFVENRLDDPETDDFGTQYQELDEDVWTLSYSGVCQPKRVDTVSKHPAPDHLLDIRTRGGRRLRVTPDHTMLRYDQDASEELHQNYWKAEKVSAQELSVGDDVPVPSPPEDGSIDDFLFSPVKDKNDHPPAVTDWDTIESVEIVGSDVDYVYCLTVEDTNTVCSNGILTGQCDGDEDCVMLLLDGLLNFSKSYLPDQRGGRMDAPLVMSSRIDPSEIDDEAHNMDVVDRYPLEFYEATRELADPGEVDVEIAEDTLGTDLEYTGFRHTHDTSNIALGPDLSAYKTLGSMMDKMDAQLEISRKLRAVDETDVAERVIEYHFLPDLIGNLRAFSRQETRCLDCGEKYRRMPLTGECRECGGRVNLTVHQGSVNKYMETAIRVAEEFGARDYTKQRLEVLEKSLESIFENDKNKQTGIADFM